MNNQYQPTSNRSSSLLIFLGVGGVITLGVLLIFFRFSNSGGKSPASLGNRQVLSSQSGQSGTGNENQDGFLGEKGETVRANKGKVFIPEEKVIDGNLKAFNFFSEVSGKTIYFFIVKASDGTYRAAANACEVCYGAKKGFRQVGDLIRCENCRVTYSKDKIALEKGGCNPGPISQDVAVEKGSLVLEVANLEKVAYLF